METLKAEKESLEKIPLIPGVYLFKNAFGKTIYVGKAKALKNRLRSYWAIDLINKTRQMMDEAATFSYIPVNSEFEALLLESALVKKYRPKYNIELKDDKSPLYIGITKEEYPRVLPFRQTQLSQKELKDVFGPFLDGRSTRAVLKRIRWIIPFSTHRPSKRPCMYYEIGLCRPCPSVIENIEDEEERKKLKQKYQKNVRKIQSLLEGNIGVVQKQLQKEIKEYSDLEEFEMAQLSLRSLESLNNMTKENPQIRSYMENPNFLMDIREQELMKLATLLKPYFNINLPRRIECYDIAHLAGTFPTASMVTFINGEPDKNYYRHFKIKEEKKNNDVDSIRSILERRKKHINDWGKPDLIIVDGGKGQVSAALEVFSNIFPVIGLAKRLETIVIKTDKGFREIRPEGPALRLIQRTRDEAHRFARVYHHKLVSKAILKSGKLG